MNLPLILQIALRTGPECLSGKSLFLFLCMHSCGCPSGGYYIPKDAAVFVNLYSIGRNPTMWKDPLQFNPDRFILNPSSGGVESMIKANGSNFHLLPFSSGRRMCVGHTLAMILLSRLVATLVHAFNWAAPPGVSSEDLLTSETGFFMLHPGPKLYLIPTPHLSSKVYQSKFN